MKELRRNIFLAAYGAGAGHLASSFSLVEIMSALYLEGIMKHDPHNPKWEDRDLLVLSKGHGSLALYTVLAKAGYFPENELNKFCRPGTMLGGEPHTLECPGVEASTGSLGHGLSIGVGMAIALKSEEKSNRVFVVAGDGECQEGSIWEAVISAPAFQLDNLTLIIDNNHIQKMDSIVNIIGRDNLYEQFSSFGWEVKTCNGHEIDDIINTLSGKWTEKKPRCLLAQTVKGKGLSIMEDNPSWHWKMPNKKELKVFMEELKITPEELDNRIKENN